MYPLDPGSRPDRITQAESPAQPEPSKNAEKAVGKTPTRKRVHESSTIPPRHSLRLADNSSAEPAPSKPRSVSTIIWLSPSSDESGRVYLPAKCTRYYKKYRVDSEEMQQLLGRTGFQAAVSMGKSEIAGTGVFADRHFEKNELIGVYEGRLTKHKEMPENIVSSYCDSIEKDRSFLAEHVYATWHEDEEGCHFLSGPDSHILWSSVTVFGKNLEFGRDGLVNGNNLAYLNHSSLPNVKPLVAFSKSQSYTVGNRLYAKEGYSADNLLILIVATDEITEGEELSFNYDTSAKDIDFKLVGYDVFPAPARYVKVTDDDVEFDPDGVVEMSEVCSSTDDSVEFELLPVADDELALEKDLASRWIVKDLTAQKQIIDLIRQDKTRILCLYIQLCHAHLCLTPTEIWSTLRRHADCIGGGHLDSTHDLRRFIRRHFSPEESDIILSGRFHSEKQTSLKRLNVDLVLRIKHKEDNPVAAMKEYLKNTVYKSDRESLHPSNIFCDAEKTFRHSDGILGKPTGYWTTENLYGFMVQHDCFECDEDQYAFMPLRYLKLFFHSESKELLPEGLRLLGEMSLYRITHEKLLSDLAAQLNTWEIRCPYEPGTWKESHLRSLDQVKAYYQSRSSVDISENIQKWKSGTARATSKLALAELQEKVKADPRVLSSIIYELRTMENPLLIKEIAKAIKWCRDLGLSPTHESIRQAIYQHSKECEFETRVKLLEGSVHLAICWINDHDQQDFFDSEEQLKALQGELHHALEKEDHNYTKLWTKLLQAKLHLPFMKIFLEEYIPKHKAGDVAYYLEHMKIERWFTPKYSPSAADKKWTYENFLEAAHRLKLSHLATKDGQSLVVLMAAKTDLPMMGLEEKGVEFNAFLERKLTEHAYTIEILSKLEQKNYPVMNALRAKRRK